MAVDHHYAVLKNKLKIKTKPKTKTKKRNKNKKKSEKKTHVVPECKNSTILAFGSTESEFETLL